MTGKVRLQNSDDRDVVARHRAVPPFPPAFTWSAAGIRT